jgi:hypothetical protein
MTMLRLIPEIIDIKVTGSKIIRSIGVKTNDKQRMCRS